MGARIYGVGAHCRCGCPPSKHEVAGMGGECVGEHCRCTGYRETDRTTPTRPATTSPHVEIGLPWLTAIVAEIEAGRRGRRGTPDRRRRAS